MSAKVLATANACPSLVRSGGRPFRRVSCTVAWTMRAPRIAQKRVSGQVSSGDPSSQYHCHECRIQVATKATTVAIAAARTSPDRRSRKNTGM